MAEFIKGLTLCECFFHEIAEPILEKHFPGLEYSAGLLGYGSDVLGYDDPTSTDHMWGPRFYLFLKQEELKHKDAIMEVFSQELPYTYRGYSVHFSEPDANDNGVRHAEYISEGKVSSLIMIYDFDDFIEGYLGKRNLQKLDYLDWLSFSEHRLLALSSGKIFYDRLGVQNRLALLAYYPEQVKFYLLASDWSIIAEEQAFMKRCWKYGDDVGSRIIASRIADRLMRLCFLYKNRNAPYSKWFGTAFLGLEIDPEIYRNIRGALFANTAEICEKHLVEAQHLVGELHNMCGITEPVDCSVRNYFSRDIRVISAENFAETIRRKLEGTFFEKMPMIATISQIGNLSTLSDDCRNQEKIKELYK